MRAKLSSKEAWEESEEVENPRSRYDLDGGQRQEMRAKNKQVFNSLVGHSSLISQKLATMGASHFYEASSNHSSGAQLPQE